MSHDADYLYALRLQEELDALEEPEPTRVSISPEFHNTLWCNHIQKHLTQHFQPMLSLCSCPSKPTSEDTMETI